MKKEIFRGEAPTLESLPRSPYPWGFMGFLILTMAVPRLYSLVNAFWVGRISMHAPAVSEQYEFVALLLEVIHETVSVGVLALVARTFFDGGRSERKDSVGIWKAGGISALVLAGGVGLMVFLGTERFTAAVGTQGAIAQETILYLRLRALGIPLEACALVGLTALKSLRRGGMVLGLALLSVCCNILFDLLLLSDFPFSLQWGLQGSALAFLGAQAILLTTSFAMLLRTAGVSLPSFAAHPWRCHIKPLFAVGGWSGAESLVRNAGYAGILVLLNSMGTDEYGGYGIAMNILWTALIPVLAVTEGTNVLVGNLLGGSRGESIPRAIRISSLLTALYLGGLGILGFFLWDSVAATFTMNPAMVAYSKTAFLGLMIPYILMGLSWQVKSLFYGTGETRPILLIALMLNGLLTLPFVLAVQRGILGLSFRNVLLYFAAALVMDLLCTLFFGVRVWRKVQKR